MADINTRISDFIWKNLSEKFFTGKKDQFWESLFSTGTELWLDTIDIEEAETAWSAEMGAFTSNSTFLNDEIQKGMYDVFISEAKSIVRDIPEENRIKEIAFILNARHGLRLAQKFGGYVNLELHTDTAHDIKAIQYYGKRIHDICPDKFIVKVPFTAEGVIGAKLLRDSGVKTNITLGFSARQNVFLTRVSRPDYLNIFVGRIGDYMINNNLGDGAGAGERAVISTQNWITGLSAENPWQTKLLVASMRNINQIESLAGADVFTIPPKLANAGRRELSGQFASRMHENYEVSIYDSKEEAHIEKFWKVDSKVLTLAEKLISKFPSTGTELIHIAHEAGCEDMFPFLSKEDKNFIATDGKIPLHTRWEKKLAEGKIAPDTLLSLSGLASFNADQRLLDNRIRSIIE